MPVVFVAYYDIDIAATHIPGVANRTEYHLSRNNTSQFFLIESTGEPTTNFTTTITHLDHDNPRHGLDISSPHRAVQHYYINGLVPSTHILQSRPIKIPSILPSDPVFCYSHLRIHHAPTYLLRIWQKKDSPTLQLKYTWQPSIIFILQLVCIIHIRNSWHPT